MGNFIGRGECGVAEGPRSTPNAQKNPSECQRMSRTESLLKEIDGCCWSVRRGSAHRAESDKETDRLQESGAESGPPKNRPHYFYDGRGLVRPPFLHLIIIPTTDIFFCPYNTRLPFYFPGYRAPITVTQNCHTFGQVALISRCL